MKYKILVYIDYDKDSGLGHVSRSRAFLEALSDYDAEVVFSSNLNPIELEPQIDFLRGMMWVSPQTAAKMSFDILYIDTYNLRVLSKISQWAIKSKVLVIDSNFTQGMPNWADLIIDLECTNARNVGFQGRYVFGDILVHSKLELAKENRNYASDRLVNNSNLKALVNFGGSIKAEQHIKELSKTFFQNQGITYIVYCPSDSIETLATYIPCKNVEINPISPKYFEDLSMCDFLVTSSGTSFIEGLFVEIPMVIFNLFANAQNNFERLGHVDLVLYLGSPPDIPTEWQKKAIETLWSRKKIQQKGSSIQQPIKTVEKDTLVSEIRILLGFEKNVRETTH